MPPLAVVPIKSFRLGNSRLSPLLQGERRRALGRLLAGHVTRCLAEAGLETVVVTADDEVRRWASGAGIGLVDDPGSGLDAAAAAGVVGAGRGAWLVLHSDLPLLAATEVRSLCENPEGGRAVLAPSADGGTSAIMSRGLFRFSYGPGSFHRHLGLLAEPRILASTGLLHDVDRPDDLASALIHPRGHWLAEALA